MAKMKEPTERDLLRHYLFSAILLGSALAFALWELLA